MKRFFSLTGLLFALLFVGCSYDDTAILDRIENLENNQKTEIATLQQQIEAINTSIAALEAAKVSLDERITNAQADADANADDIAKLQEAKTTIEQRITTLQTYVDTELQKAKDWATATFATLEQYNSLAGDMATLQSVVDGMDKVLKNWVNEQLDGYYTIAEVDAALEALQNSIDESSEALQKDIDELSTKVDSMKAELAEAYTKAIDEAINANNGVIDGKIADAVAEVNDRIDSEVAAINARIDALEERIEDLEEALDKIKTLDIEFDIESGKACMAGASIEFGYTIVGGDEDTEVESFGDGGWRADVVATDATSGRIRVTASKDGGNGKVIVLATSGVGASTMKSIRFDEGVLADIADRYDVASEACTLTVPLKTNLDYEVRIAEGAQSWLSVADTRATMREETLTFSIAENPEDSPARIAVVELVNDLDEVLQSFEIVQKSTQLFATSNLTLLHSDFNITVTPKDQNTYWTYYIWKKESYDNTSTEDIAQSSLWGIKNTCLDLNLPFEDFCRVGEATISSYEKLNNNTEYVLVLFHVNINDYYSVYYNNYTAIPFKTLEPTPGAAATLEVSEPIIVANGFKYDIKFIVKTNENAVDLKYGALLWNYYDFAKYWDPNDWSQIQAFFMFRTSVSPDTLEAAKSADGAVISFPNVDKEDYVFFFEALNDENTPTQFAVRVEPTAFDNAQ